jgi:hypothetical protein
VENLFATEQCLLVVLLWRSLASRAKRVIWVGRSPKQSPFADVRDDDPDLPFLALLHARRFSPAIWDGFGAFAAEGVRFQPDAPIRRADAAHTLYLLGGRQIP